MGKYKESDLVIKYKLKGEKVSKEIDDVIETAMEDLGYKSWASGYSFGTGYRDIAFDYSQIKTTPAIINKEK